ncbi:MAG: protein kinase [Eubacteriales bacterium]|nr:protein kinase [Eubacteriales bacterium]
MESLEFTEKYEKEMKKFPLPQIVREQYQIEECLKESEESFTLLAKARLTGTFCIIKQAKGKARPFLEWEYTVLKDLQEKNLRGIPHPYCLLEEGDSVYFLREYIEGKSLYELKEEGDFSQSELLHVGRELCGIILQFHELKTPLIHRDVKPENIIRTREGKYILVDFGTARWYREEGTRDTFVVGSCGTAAPEQFGFSQTDRRTDVYAIGRTLCYLAAGTYDNDGLKNADVSRRLKRVIKKASAFDPGKRYGSVIELEKALRNCKYQWNYFAAALVMVSAAFCITALALRGYGGGNGGKPTEKNSAVVDNRSFVQEESKDGIVFKEPLVEKAVRKTLGLDEQAVITEEMLSEITELRIVGNRILEPEDDLTVRMWIYVNGESQHDGESGGISDLTDFTYMKRLSCLALCNQDLSDLSVLEGLPLETLYISGNDVLDISPLGKMPKLETMYIGTNPCVDLEPLRDCVRLKTLNIDDMTVRDLDFLEDLALERLSIQETKVAKGGLEKLLTQKYLRAFTMDNFGTEEAEILSRMDSIQELYCYHNYLPGDLQPLAGMDSLSLLNLRTGLESLEGIENFPNLQYLHIEGSSVTDLSPIAQAPKLLDLGIQNLQIEDYTPVLEHPTLERIFCDEQQKEEILKSDPETDLEFIIP